MDFKEVFEQAPVPILILQDDRIAHCNAAAYGVYRFLGHEVTEAHLGTLDPLLLIVPEERDEARRNLALILQSGQTLRNIPRTLADVSGHRVAALCSAGPCRWEGQAALAVSFVLLGLRPRLGELAGAPGQEPLPDDRASLLQVLTPRETRVALLLVEGHTLREIGRQLGVQVSTLRGYVKSIYVKLGVHSRAELVRRVLGHR